jgi:hypothetical protein
MEVWASFMWFRICCSVGLLQTYLGSIRVWKFLQQLKDYWLLNNVTELVPRPTTKHLLYDLNREFCLPVGVQYIWQSGVVSSNATLI